MFVFLNYKVIHKFWAGEVLLVLKHGGITDELLFLKSLYTGRDGEIMVQLLINMLLDIGKQRAID